MTGNELPSLRSYCIEQRRCRYPRHLNWTIPTVLITVAVVTALLVALFAPLFIATAASLASVSPGGFFFFSFIAGGLAGLSYLFALRLTLRKVHEQLYRRVEAAEGRLREGRSEDVFADLDLLASEHLEHGHPIAAEYYSDLLLRYSESMGEGETDSPVKLPGVMHSTSTFASRPSYHKSPLYYLVCLYQTTGTILLTDEWLHMDGGKYSFKLHLSDIVDLSIASHSRWLKPAPLYYISVTYLDDGEHSTFYLSPFSSHCDTIWDINKRVRQWYELIREQMQQVQRDEEESFMRKLSDAAKPETSRSPI